jgi:hypothetical protein
VRLTTYHHIVPMSRNLGALTLLDRSGPAWPVMGVPYLFLHSKNGYTNAPEWYVILPTLQILVNLLC